MHAIVQTLWHSSLPPIRQGIATPRLLGSCRKDGYRSSPFEELCSPREWMECMHAHTTQPAWNADKEQEHFQQLPLPPAQPGLQNTWNADKEQERFQQLPLPPAQPGLRPGMS